MGFRFRKSVKIAPGVKLNLGKKSASVSFGVKGARHTISTTGRRTTSVGIPGSGVYYTTSSSAKKSYNSSSNSYNSYNDNAYSVVESFNEDINFVTTLYKDYDCDYDWVSISTTPAPFNLSEKGPNEMEAIEKLENYNPNFIEKLFKSISDKKVNVLKDNITIAIEKDKELYKEWNYENELSKLILSGNLDSYSKIIEHTNFSENLSGILSSFKFNILNKDVIEIDCNVNIDNIIPEEYPSVTKTGKLSIKKYTKTAYYELVKLYICGFAIRTARNIFGLLPLNTVIIHIENDNLNTQTGYTETNAILSVEFDKEMLNNLNFDLIDPLDALGNFNHNVRFLKTKGFQNIEKINSNHYQIKDISD